MVKFRPELFLKFPCDAISVEKINFQGSFASNLVSGPPTRTWNIKIPEPGMDSRSSFLLALNAIPLSYNMKLIKLNVMRKQGAVWGYS